jgi:hypothetical protein
MSRCLPAVRTTARTHAQACQQTWGECWCVRQQHTGGLAHASWSWQQGSETGPTPGTARDRASASTAAAAWRAFSPVRDILAAMSPVTIGVENDVPLHFAMP